MGFRLSGSGREAAHARIGSLRSGALLLAVVLAAGCHAERSAAPGLRPRGADATILDGAHTAAATTPHFFFLPPTVIPPALPLPPFVGTFDPAATATARVCAGSGPCSASAAIAIFSGTGGTGGTLAAQLRVNSWLQVYGAVWDTRQCVTGPCSLTLGAPYRLHVYATTAGGAEVELGAADLQVVQAPLEDQPPPTVDFANFSPLVQNAPYGIAFRVEQGVVGSVTIAPATAQLTTIDAPLLLTATVQDLHGATLTRAVVWASSNSAVATVDAGGLLSPVSMGQTTITATSEGRAGTATVTVVRPPVASVTVAAATPSSSVVVGGSLAVAATLRDAKGNVLTGRDVQWSSREPAVATVAVDAQGNAIVIGVSPGTATIIATSEGQSGALAVQVLPPPVARVSINSPASTILVGAGLPLSVTLYDANGKVLTGRAVQWYSSNSTVATVALDAQANATVVGVALGTASIKAVSEGVAGTIDITVTAAMGTVSGTVVHFWSSLPFGSVSVSLTSGDGTVTYAGTDANGNFGFGRVPAGVYRLAVSEARGQCSIAAPVTNLGGGLVEVVAGVATSVTVKVSCPSDPGTLRVTTTSVQGRPFNPPLGGVTIKVNDPSGIIPLGITGLDGTVTFAGLTPSTVDLVTALGVPDGCNLPAGPTTVTLSAGAVTDLPMPISCFGSGFIKGTVSTSVSGKGLPNVGIMIDGGVYGASIDASGYNYYAQLQIGTHTVSLRNLPAGCVDPGTQTVAVVNAGTVFADFKVTCPF